MGWCNCKCFLLCIWVITLCFLIATCQPFFSEPGAAGSRCTMYWTAQQTNKKTPTTALGFHISRPVQLNQSVENQSSHMVFDTNLSLFETVCWNCWSHARHQPVFFWNCLLKLLWKKTKSSIPSIGKQNLFFRCSKELVLPRCISEGNNKNVHHRCFLFDASCPFTLHVVKAHHTLCQRFQKSRSCATTQLEALTHLSC